MTKALGKMNAGAALAYAASRHADALAFYCSSSKRRFTFRQTHERTNRLAQSLLGLGLKKGDVVALLLSNRIEIVEAFFALARTGIVGLPLNYRLASSELTGLMGAIGAKALIYESGLSVATALVRDAPAGIEHFIEVGDDPSAGGHEYEAMLAAAAPTLPEVDIDEDDPFYFNLTSGTTGAPKPYLLTQYNNCVVGLIFPAFDLSGRDVVMTVFPIFGRVGFAWVMGSVIYGIPNVLATFEPAKVLNLIATERVTTVNLVPTMGAMLLPVQASAPVDLSSLRAIIFAGSVLPASIREQASAALCPGIYEYYGMNEMGALIVSNPDDRARRPESVGKPTLFSEIRIVGEHGEELGPNDVGEVLGRSPMSATSYFGSPDASAETFRDGWLHTGDLGYRDEEGYIYIRGRKKDMIVTGGQNVHAAEVEGVILRHPGAAECAVFGVPDDLWGERITCVVVPRPGVRLTAEELDGFCRQHLGAFKVPKAFFITDEALPRTANGKIQKFVLAERYARGEAADA
jgi:acyl-CoA synthetase (AMP-forming)/AMP-acid ligase II